MPDSVVVVLVTAVPIMVVVVLLVFMLRRQRRDYAALGSSEAANAAYRLPRRVNWQINRRIRGGRAVEDPDLAKLASARAEHLVRASELGLRRVRALRWLHLLAAALFLAGIVLTIIDDDGLTRSNAFRIGCRALLACWLVAMPARCYASAGPAGTATASAA